MHGFSLPSLKPLQLSSRVTILTDIRIVQAFAIYITSTTISSSYTVNGPPAQLGSPNAGASGRVGQPTTVGPSI